MRYWDDLIRFLNDVIASEQMAHAIKHMSMHAFQHFMKDHAPHLWELVRENIGEVFAFVQEWVVEAFLA